MDKLKMSFKRLTVNVANCAKCGEAFTTTDAGQDVYDKKSELIEAMVEYDWQVIGEKAYCEHCKK